jgi:ribonuclease P protein component
MLAKQYRLSGKNNFDKVLKEGRFVQSDAFGLAYLKREDEEVSRFGFIVSTKVSKTAILRNRVKRALSEAARFINTKIEKGYNIVFLAKGKSTKVPTDQLMREVGAVLERAGLVKQ